ncbi:hypothetical protein [Corynebacterium uberis]|uniref:hypothetical protein n=1 Tax=Corynebacterium uberis TaxID=2883169 RepID=UPI001D0A8C9C|nr:hypothetical protein [Corynebacterium uberis]UDL73122.1 hypothetical protein LH391_08385 [Corynebacterium uberis]
MRSTTSRDSGESGSVTIEAALSLAVLITVFAAIVAGMATVAAHIAAIAAAGAAARAAAIGVSAPPDGRATVSITQHDGWVRAQATVGSPLGARTATAVFPQEVAAP